MITWRSLTVAFAFLVAGCSIPGAPAPSVQKKVLMVIANNGFYYQEYADPRRALEESGIQVVVAAGTLTQAVPHAETGQPAGDPGTVIPDLTLEQADSGDFDALVIAGGWGATNYYFAYPGTLLDSQWAPVPAAAGRINTLIGNFLTQGKPILGVCNGVNVLSWARVGGVSPLEGKQVSAPSLDVPDQTYKSVTYYAGGSPRLPMYVFAADNGGIVKAFNSVGDSSTGTDDVTEDGLILTAQDNTSAYWGGRLLAQRL